jgi:hypothetical protein
MAKTVDRRIVELEDRNAVPCLETQFVHAIQFHYAELSSALAT